MLALVLALLLTLSTLPWSAAPASACPDSLSEESAEAFLTTLPASSALSALATLKTLSTLPTLSLVYEDEGKEAEEDEDDDDDDASYDSAVPQPDTTIVVRPGVSLEIENFGGAIAIKTWDRDAIKIAADHSLRDKIVIVRTGSAIRLKVKSRRWVPASVRYRIVAPRWMKLELSGVNTDISIEDSRGEVRAETVQGDITLKDTQGFASLSSVQGAVVAQGVRGRVEASSVNQAIHLTNVVGTIFAESVNGGIMIDNVQSDSVEASTVNGPVTFEGKVADTGYYRFATHNGCIDVAMPEHSNATLSLSTFSGGIDSSFPVSLKKIQSKRFQTTIGKGSARIELESFQGTIYLRRPGEARSACQGEDEDENGKNGKQEKAEKTEKDSDDDE
jgi:hypothetical protein